MKSDRITSSYGGRITCKVRITSIPSSGKQDFEGYRIYVSNSGLETEYELLAEYDVVDFAYYSLNDLLVFLSR